MPADINFEFTLFMIVSLYDGCGDTSRRSLFPWNCAVRPPDRASPSIEPVKRSTTARFPPSPPGAHAAGF
jgi:hypothetical protein